MDRKASSVTHRVIVRIVGLIDSRSNNISWPDFLEREGARTTGNRQARQSANTSRGRRIFPRLESTQSVDGSARNARNATPFVRYLARASPLRSFRGSRLQMYSCVPWLSGLPPPTISATVRIAALLQPSRRYRRQGERSRLSVSDIPLPSLPAARIYSPSKRARNPWLIPLRTDRELVERELYYSLPLRLPFPFFYIILSLYCFIHSRVDMFVSFVI